MKKSSTQMTKVELLDTLRLKDIIIAQLNSRIDELESMAIRSRAIPLDGDSSRLLTTMSQRIHALEAQVNGKIS